MDPIAPNSPRYKEVVKPNFQQLIKLNSSLICSVVIKICEDAGATAGIAPYLDLVAMMWWTLARKEKTHFFRESSFLHPVEDILYPSMHNLLFKYQVLHMQLSLDGGLPSAAYASLPGQRLTKCCICSPPWTEAYQVLHMHPSLDRGLPSAAYASLPGRRLTKCCICIPPWTEAYQVLHMHPSLDGGLPSAAFASLPGRRLTKCCICIPPWTEAYQVLHMHPSLDGGLPSAAYASLPGRRLTKCCICIPPWTEAYQVLHMHPSLDRGLQYKNLAFKGAHMKTTTQTTYTLPPVVGRARNNCHLCNYTITLMLDCLHLIYSSSTYFFHCFLSLTLTCTIN